MFNGMMDPEMIKLAQEQMSRMSPDEFAKIQQQVMSNPDLVRMASESMKNMNPGDWKQAAQQLKNARPEDMAQIGEKMANASPHEIAAMQARVDAQVSYELNAANMLKNQGNEFHSQGRYADAMQKYLLVKKNLQEIPSSKARTLSLACTLNLMSCYLKTKQYDDCIKEGSEVLEYDAKNIKALYRRGQAYKELERFEDAVSDFKKALELSPDDETIADVLRDAEERLSQEGGHQARSGVVIEEITDKAQAAPSENLKSASVREASVSRDASRRASQSKSPAFADNSESIQALRTDPESIRSFQNFISKANPETLASLSGAQAADVPLDMFSTASNMISQMSPDELQNMLQMASSFQRGNPNSTGGLDGSFNGLKPGSVPPNITPDMLKTASDMMSKMSPEEVQKMFEMSSTFRGKGCVHATGTSNTGQGSSDDGSGLTEFRGKHAANGSGETSSSGNISSTSRSGSQASFPTSAADMQEQMRNQMNDPAMRQMFTSMMKNMNPEMMASMSGQFGMKLSPEDAAKAQQAMSSLSPDDLDRMMKWAGRIQKGAEGAKKAKKLLLGRPGMILAICMLIIAVILHRLGFIGR